MELKVNEEYAKLVPMSDEDYQALKQSIREKGLLVSIDVNEDHLILDGNHRYQAMKELGLEVTEDKIRVIKIPKDDEVEYILRVNLERRHLSSFSKFELASKLRDLLAERAKNNSLINLKKGQESSNVEISAIGRADDKVGDLINLSGDTVSFCRYIERYGSEKDKEALRKGERTIWNVYNRLHEEEAKNEIINSLSKDDQVLLKNSLEPFDKVNSKLLKQVVEEARNIESKASIEVARIKDLELRKRKEDEFKAQKFAGAFNVVWKRQITPTKITSDVEKIINPEKKIMSSDLLDQFESKLKDKLDHKLWKIEKDDVWYHIYIKREVD
jgi:ParB-like chromosome segregation protein Spo0J